ncbi:MAG: hypothetical protein AAB650_02035, partial [Patescibacteria group bacterium]
MPFASLAALPEVLAQHGLAGPAVLSLPLEEVTLRLLNLARDNGEWVPRPKSLNYMNALLGAAELKQRGAAADRHDLPAFQSAER